MKKFTALVATSLSVLALTACTATKAPTPTPTATPVAPKPKPAQVALVLGGGGAYGFAHVGVLEALHENGIKPDMVVGTSVGAIIGAMYASGKSPQAIRQIVVNLDETTLIDFTPSKQGVIAGDKLRAFVNTHTGNKAIEQFPTPFIAVATHKQSKQATPFYAGESGLAVQASASIPNIFIAPRIPATHGHKYMDGGQSALLPVRLAKSMGAKKVIAANLLPQKSVPTTQATKNATITRDEGGVYANWGNQSVKIPIDFQGIKDIELPFGLNMSQILKDVPTELKVDLPAEFPDELPTKPQAFWKLLYTPTSTASQADLDASDVVITPALEEFAVFDTTQKTQMIQKGKEATMQKMNDIEKLMSQR